jgi:protein-tyrosine phosphatase
VRVLFVCLGNICRSPSAEAVMRAKVLEAGLEDRIEVDSAGTGDWHVGESSDARAREAARARGFELESVARQVQADDFEEFDLIVAMDRANLRTLQRLAGGESTHAELCLLREFEPGAPTAGAAAHGGASDGDAGALEVPDPYYGGPAGFDRVLDLLEASCEGLLEELVRRLPPDTRPDGHVSAREVRD